MEIINLIDSAQLKSKIAALTQADLSKVAYPKILNEITSIGGIPLTTTTINSGQLISRARFNRNGEIFTSEDQISYRNDLMNITEFGRANVHYHSVFYGAIDYPDDKFHYVTPIYELKFNHLLPKDLTVGLITVGFWQVVSPIEVLNIVFNDELSIKDQRLREDIESYLNIYRKDYPDRIEDLEYLLKFISKEFFRDIKRDSDYKISAAYSAYCMNRGIPGIIYPSKATEGNGINIALSHNIVESHLSLKSVVLLEMEKESETSFILRPIANAQEFGFLNSEFKYYPIEPKVRPTIMR